MTPFEAFLAFLVVAGVLAIPITAIISRNGSPIGQAIADRIRRKTERKYGRIGAEHASAAIDDGSIADLHARLEFVERLVDRELDRPTNSLD
jgi:hypothetical protein